jgi:hypothetical protein
VISCCLGLMVQDDRWSNGSAVLGELQDSCHMGYGFSGCDTCPIRGHGAHQASQNTRASDRCSQKVWHLVLLVCRQHVYLSMAARNPRRGTMCEPPSVKRIDLYCHSDLGLAAFIVAAAPHATKKCQVSLHAHAHAGWQQSLGGFVLCVGQCCFLSLSARSLPCLHYLTT